jgi:hypothetical protein
MALLGIGAISGLKDFEVVTSEYCADVPLAATK